MVEKHDVGQKIYSLRKKKGITQDRLAKLVNVTPQAISKWENGAALPDTCLLPALAELFHVSMEELLCVNEPQDTSGQNQSGPVFLPGITYDPCTPPLVGCIRSSLAYLGVHVSAGWISAPYAFLLNINDEVSFKGPEYWNDNGCFDELIRNCGGIVMNFGASNSKPDIAEKRMYAWHLVRDSINKGLPCYAWELDKPTYYMLAGYDETGYYYIDPDTGRIAGPKPYTQLGESAWGHLEVHIIRPGSISDNLKTVKDVFEYAINVSNPLLYPPNKGYTMGIEAYAVWWRALKNATADPYGVAYNAAFWSKCKRMAVLFLQESKLRLGILENNFHRAITAYETAAKSLVRLSQLFPLPIPPEDGLERGRIVEAIDLLQSAQASEREGLAQIGEILQEIYKIW